LVPKCLRAELSGHFGTSAEVSSGHFGTGAEVSWYRSVLGPKCPVSFQTDPGYCPNDVGDVFQYQYVQKVLTA